MDQGISDVYSCPTCRSPLFPSTSGNDGNDGGEIEHTLHENLGLNLLRPTGQAVPIDPSFDHQQNSTENIWRFDDFISICLFWHVHLHVNYKNRESVYLTVFDKVL